MLKVSYSSKVAAMLVQHEVWQSGGEAFIFGA